MNKQRMTAIMDMGFPVWVTLLTNKNMDFKISPKRLKQAQDRAAKANGFKSGAERDEHHIAIGLGL